MLYAGFEPAAPRAVGLLIHPATRFASGASLSGARIAVQRGSNAHYLVTGLLAQQSASADASLRFLAPADAHAAFARGDVDAWAVWDPLLSDAIGQGARLLADARGISANYYFCMAGRALAADRAALDTILATLRRVERWTNANRDGAAGILARATGLAARTWARSLANTDYGVRPMSPEPIAEQQHIADAFFASGLLPRAIRIPA